MFYDFRVVVQHSSFTHLSWAKWWLWHGFRIHHSFCVFVFFLSEKNQTWLVHNFNIDDKKISLSQCVDHNMEDLVVQLRLHHHETYNLRYSSFIKWQGTKLIALVQPLIWLPIKVCWTLFWKEVHNFYMIPWTWPSCISLMALHEALMFSNLNAT